MKILIESLKSLANLKSRDSGLFSLICFSLLSAGILYITLKNELGLYLLGLIFSIVLIVLYVKFPKYWLFSIASVSFLLFQQSDIGIGIMDLFFGGFVIAGSMIWIFWKIAVQKEKIVENIADWSILFFFIFVILNLPVALANDITFVDWVREYILLSSILIYFPVKYHIKEKKDIQILLALFGISLLILAVNHFVYYKNEGLSQAVYAYQLQKSVATNQAIFCSGILFAILFSVTTKRILYRFFFLFISTIFIGALILSFSRTFWIAIIAEIIFFLFYLNRKQNIILIICLATITFIAGISLSTVFKDKSKFIITLIENRAKTATKGTNDESYKLRLVEYDIAKRGISDSPWGGVGFGYVIHFFDAAARVTLRGKNIHNGYYFLILRLGISLVIFFFIPTFYMLIKGEYYARKIKDGFYKSIILASVFTILIVLIGNALSNQLFVREGGMTLGISYALINISMNTYKRNNPKQII